MQPACSLHAGRRRRYAGRRPRDAGRRRPAHGVDAGNVHVYFNGGGYTWSVMQAACNLHAGCMHAAATCNLLHAGCCILQPPAYRRNAACMQPACISSVALALQFSYNFAMSCLWCLWEVYEVYEKSMRLTDKSVQKRPRRNILTCCDVARWSRSPTDLSLRFMSLIDKSVPVEYRHAFSTALIQLCYSNYYYQPMISRQIILRHEWILWRAPARRAYCIIIDSKINRPNKQYHSCTVVQQL